MKWLKFILPTLVLLAVIPILLPSSFKIERSIRIKSQQKVAFSYVANFQTWSEWSPWLEKEPSAEYEVEGIPGVVGGYAQWKGDIIGSGKQTLTEVQDPESIKTKVEFFAPNRSEAESYFRFGDYGDSVEVTWGMQGQLSYPIQRVIGLAFPSLIAPYFEKGLENLKNQLESADSPQ